MSALLALAATLAWPLSAPDQHSTMLRSIDRSIGRQPAYQGKPEYCLLVFGKHADVRMWMVRDGDRLYIDRKLNGDLTDPENRVDGSDRFVVSAHPSHVSQTFQSLTVSFTPEVRMIVRHAGSDGPMQFVGSVQAERLMFRKNPADAPIIHLNGPMEFGIFKAPRSFGPNDPRPSVRDRSLRLIVGTPGVGPGTFAAYHCKCRLHIGPLHGLIEYPAKETGGTPIREEVTWQSLG